MVAKAATARPLGHLQSRFEDELCLAPFHMAAGVVVVVVVVLVLVVVVVAVVVVSSWNSHNG